MVRGRYQRRIISACFPHLIRNPLVSSLYQVDPQEYEEPNSGNGVESAAPSSRCHVLSTAATSIMSSAWGGTPQHKCMPVAAQIRPLPSAMPLCCMKGMLHNSPQAGLSQFWDLFLQSLAKFEIWPKGFSTTVIALTKVEDSSTCSACSRLVRQALQTVALSMSSTAVTAHAGPISSETRHACAVIAAQQKHRRGCDPEVPGAPLLRGASSVAELPISFYLMTTLPIPAARLEAAATLRWEAACSSL